MSVEIIIFVIGLLALSIVFNIFFCIRCCAMSHYLKKLYSGEPRNACCDHLLCIGKVNSRGGPSRINYIRIPEHRSLMAQPINYQSAVTIRPGSPIRTQNSFKTTTNSTYPATIPSPILLRNITVSPAAAYETQPGVELVYDEVNHSTYTAVNSSQKDQLLPIMSTPDGRNWILDPTGRVYLPCAQSSQPMELKQQIPDTRVNSPSNVDQISAHSQPATTYESNRRGSTCVPEYEQHEMFRAGTHHPSISYAQFYAGKRCATPLPSRPMEQQQRTSSTILLAHVTNAVTPSTDLVGTSCVARQTHGILKPSNGR